jgi:hypothetical protein
VAQGVELGGGRPRVHFRETYHAFNPVLRRLFEARVHRAISKSNDATLAAAIKGGVAAVRRRASGAQRQ